MPPLKFPPHDPDDEPTGINIRLRRGLWKRLDRVAKAEGKSRNYVIEFFLTWAVDEYEGTGRRT